jgi:gamma-glutamylcyclotransferase
MLTEWLKPRCRSAKPVGIAEVVKFSVEFSKRSRDSSGKATLMNSSNCSLGVVFEIDAVEMPDLDRAEGNGYGRCDSFSVRLVDRNATVQTITYLALEPETDLKPYDWYLALIIAGAREHELNQAYVARLGKVAYDFDRDERRRNKAIAALERSGFADYRTLLSEG